MNRELKFRAYDSYLKRMLYTGFSIIGEVTLFSGLEVHVMETQIEGVTHLERLMSLVIMQFTGLKDQNSTPIYEGDILREPPKDDWEKKNYACFEVFFHDGDANSDYNIGYSMNRMHCHGAVCGGVVLSFKPKTVSKMIVIGNVYENPEYVKL